MGRSEAAARPNDGPTGTLVGLTYGSMVCPRRFSAPVSKCFVAA